VALEIARCVKGKQKMKKLIAMLLCIALVAALGVQAFAVDTTNQDKKDQYDLQVKVLKENKAVYTDKAAVLTEVENLYKELYKAKAAIPASDPDRATKIADLNDEYQDKLDEIKANTKYAAALETDTGKNVWILDKGAPEIGMKYYDADIKWYKDKAATFDPAIKEAQRNSDKYAEKIADEATKAERDALVEKLTKGIDQTTEAGKLLATAIVAKYDAGQAAASAKKLAEAAKATIATAQKGAYTSAQALVLEAQTAAYTAMQKEITTAVNDYVAGVNTAIAEFRAELP
jgi:hypothetical protein